METNQQNALSELNELKRDIERRENELKERSKELECLYSISKIAHKNQTIDATMNKIINLIPSSWQYPEITCARLMINDKEYRTGNFKRTKHRLFSEIRTGSQKSGFIEIFYTMKMPIADEGPFLRAERKLLNAIAERIGKIIERRQTEIKLKKSNRQLQELFEHLQDVRENERKKIAYELHDDLGHALTALKLDLRWILKNIKDDRPVTEKISSMNKEIDGIIDSIRDIAMELRPALLDDFGLIEALIFYSGEFEKRSGIKTVVTSRVAGISLKMNYSVGIFRIIQELLTNIVKHAKAERVEINIDMVEDRLRIKLKDNGIGIREEALMSNKSFGILGVRERMEIWGGEFSILGRTGEGTLITMHFPINKEGNEND